ncbi:MAG: tripartite tricarboxylate transporter substrate binding protein [Burkholderiales bacterium]|nr:tripartite tricarboxylate transporter substrate binding protein [Burkholderiales bacterium]
MMHRSIQTRRSLIALLGATLATSFAGSVHAKDDYPNKPIRIVVPFPPGGGADITARLLGKGLEDVWKQPVIVENREGAGGMIGARQVARSKPDGYTFVTSVFSFYTFPVMFKNPGFDSQADLAPVSLLMEYPLVVAVTPDSPVKSVAELLALLKKQRDAATVGVTVFGGAGHLAAEMLKQQAGVDTQVVVYKGGAPMAVDLIGGRLTFAFGHIAALIEHARSGRVRVLAVTTSNRSSLLPDVPTMAEAGLSAFDISEIVGLLAPSGTPRPVVDKLSAELRTIIKSPETRDRLEKLGAILVANTPDEYAASILERTKLYTAVARKAGITPE